VPITVAAGSYLEGLCFVEIGTLAVRIPWWNHTAAKRNCLWHPTSEVKNIGAWIRTLHVIRTAHDFRERLLQ
jgi:hypothetical protein